MAEQPRVESPGKPLLVTTDLQVLDDLLRLCAAVGAELQVARDVAGAYDPWSAAPLVFVGGDVAREVVQAGLPRRSGVLLIGVDLDDAGVWDDAVALGAESVVFLPDGEAWVVDRIADAVEGDSSGCVVAVVGGRGGAGATTLATALAVTAARARLRCMLVDADPLGGGIDLALGGEDSDGLRWPELTTTAGRVSSRALWAALPEVHRMAVLSYDRREPLRVPPPAMRAVLRAGRRSSDLMVIDLPRQRDDATQLALTEADCTLLVVPAEVRAVAAAGRVAASVADLTSKVSVVVRGPSPAGLTAEVVADSLGLPLLGWLDAEPGLAQSMERGEPPARRGKGPLADFCRTVLAGLAITPHRVA